MICSIHQPNFFPWYPYFQKIQKSDVFVILINCQFEKNNFQNRFNIGEKWYTMSTNKGLEPIVNKRYVSNVKDWKTIKGGLHQYSKILNQFDDCITDNLSITNINIIKKICQMLSIKTEIVTDYPTNLVSTERLVDLCKTYHATTYLSGSSGKNYMDLSLFEQSNIKVEFQEEKDMIKKPILEILQTL